MTNFTTEGDLVLIKGAYLARTGYLISDFIASHHVPDSPLLARATDKDLPEILEKHEQIKSENK